MACRLSNGLAADKPLSLSSRFRAWVATFKDINEKSMLSLQSMLHAAMATLSPKQLGLNGNHILSESILDWAWCLGASQWMQVMDRRDPVHMDGGASFLHCGLTLCGSRRLGRVGAKPPEEQLQRVHSRPTTGPGLHGVTLPGTVLRRAFRTK